MPGMEVPLRCTNAYIVQIRRMYDRMVFRNSFHSSLESKSERMKGSLPVFPLPSKVEYNSENTTARLSLYTS